MRAYGLTVLRLCVASVFIAHGLQKLLGLWGGPGLQGTAAMVKGLGFPFPMPLALVLTATELGGGILLAVGWLTPWVALALAVDMGIAIWKVHYPHGFFLAPGNRGQGIEFVLVLLGALLCLAFSGSGALSIDEWRNQHHEARARSRARLRKV
jgi:putative oxidoreductase